MHARTHTYTHTDVHTHTHEERIIYDMEKNENELPIYSATSVVFGRVKVA